MRIRPSDEILQEPFWQGLAAGRLLFQRCTACSTFRHPPNPVCARCHSFEHEWTAVAGRASLYSYTVVRHSTHASLDAQIPYVVALVDLDEGVRMVTGIKDAAPGDLEVGMRLTCRIETLSPGFALPYFVPATAAATDATPPRKEE